LQSASQANEIAVRRAWNIDSSFRTGETLRPMYRW
jgi:hypothetical protein